MQTALFQRHQAQRAKFTVFAGWEMPIYYQGVLQEHAAVRRAVGLFDVSHMGQIDISGPDTIPFLDYLSTNTVHNKPLGKALYTVFCNATGGTVDDLLIYLISKEYAFLVVNASNRASDLKHIQTESLRFQVKVLARDTDGILSIQGPHSHQLLLSLFPKMPALKPMEIWSSPSVRVSRTGYTGEEGYEVFTNPQDMLSLWDRCLILGKSLNLMPCGLGARDLLRMEMGYALYGHELSPTIAPIESIAQWTVKLKAHDFLGKPALSNLVSTPHRYPIALVGCEGALAREGSEIFVDNQTVGHVTSGAFSPILQKPIALGLVDQPLALDAVVHINIRQKKRVFRTVKLPFIPNR